MVSECVSSSSSSCRAGSMDIPDPLSPLFPIVHRSRQVLRQHPVSSHSCWIYVRAGRPDFARPCVGVHKSTSLMSSSLFLQQCPACLVRLTWIVFVIGGRWPYSWCLVGCCRQDLFKIACSILIFHSSPYLGTMTENKLYSLYTLICFVLFQRNIHWMCFWL